MSYDEWKCTNPADEELDSIEPHEPERCACGRVLETWDYDGVCSRCHYLEVEHTDRDHEFLLVEVPSED